MEKLLQSTRLQGNVSGSSLKRAKERLGLLALPMRRLRRVQRVVGSLLFSALDTSLILSSPLARMMPMTTPKKKAAVPATPGAAQRARLPLIKTPGTVSFIKCDDLHPSGTYVDSNASTCAQPWALSQSTETGWWQVYPFPS